MQHDSKINNVQMYRPRVAPSALDRLRHVLDSGWIGLGPVTEEFENELQRPELIGKNPVLVNSGTAALHLALVAGGVRKGSAVIVSANTFVSTAAVVLFHQCRVIIADVERVTGNIDPDSVRSIIESTPDVSAVIVVHYSGIPCDVAALSEIVGKYGAVVIEDCAHAVGSIWNGHPLSASPNIQAYSFHATKALAVGEGGCVTFPDAESADRARRLRRLGIDMSTRSWGNPYDIPELGFKYNMGDVAAAIGMAQLENLPSELDKRQSIMWRYRERLADSPVELVRERDSTDRSGGFAVPALVPERDRVRKEMDSYGIGTEIYFKPLNSFSIDCTGTAPVADRFASDVICLPIHPSIDFDSVDYVCDRLLEAVA